MYSSTQSFTLQCVSGETGDNYTASATATSVITQDDANAKALGMARTLAYELIQCTFVPGVSPTIYYSAEATASANNDVGYQTDTFSVTLPAGSLYSTESQEAADAAAQVAAQAQADAKRDREQIPIFQNLAQTWQGSCPGGTGDGYSVTITVPANTFTSDVSESDASQAALADAKAQVAALIALNCTETFYSAVQSYTATCVGPEVGTPVTVTNPVGYVTTVVSQAAADAESLALATAAAEALLVCGAGYVNVEQSYTAVCQVVYGPNWEGDNNTVVIPAGEYVSAVSQAAADSAALAAATSQAIAGLSCVWGGGPFDP